MVMFYEVCKQEEEEGSLSFIKWAYFRLWNDIDGKTKELWEKLVPVSLCPPQIPHGLKNENYVHDEGNSWLIMEEDVQLFDSEFYLQSA
jgi:hypothetical protein